MPSSENGDVSVEDISVEELGLPARIARRDHERIVRDGLWPKIRKVLARIPFAEDALAAWYCASDPKVPARVRAVLLGALAYFVLPIDTIPDIFMLVGFTDDASVLTLAIAMVGSHITAEHRRKAAEQLSGLKDETGR